MHRNNLYIPRVLIGIQSGNHKVSGKLKSVVLVSKKDTGLGCVRCWGLLERALNIKDFLRLSKYLGKLKALA